MQLVRKADGRLGPLIFLLIAVGGLFYVKWLPYYHRAFVAAANHSIGQSIVMGTAASPPAPSWDAALGYSIAYGNAIWRAMVLGLLLGSAVQALLPVNWVARTLGRTSFGSAVVGGILSIPGMMCTCCAAPVVIGLRKQRASPGGAIAFWLGNSILNPATLIFMGLVLGWHWSALRLALGLVMVLGIGYLANRMATPEEAERAELQIAELSARAPQSGPFARWIRILSRMALWILPEYIVLILLLGAARAWLFPHVGPEIGNHLGWIAALALAGTLFVIPTAGEVPIVQAMLALGMGVGPAGALLMTLPPISVPSVAMLVAAFRWQVLAVVTVSVVALGIVGGLLAVALGF
jgi:uncharacterized membrane protein YraQ (UPF0718 family)